VPNFKVSKKCFPTHIFFFILQFNPFSFWSFNFILKVHYVYFLVTRFGRGGWNTLENYKWEIKLLFGHITTIKKIMILVSMSFIRREEVQWGVLRPSSLKKKIDRGWKRFFFQFNCVFFYRFKGVLRWEISLFTW
jgi:hypothetical protein